MPKIKESYVDKHERITHVSYAYKRLRKSTIQIWPKDRSNRGLLHKWFMRMSLETLERIASEYTIFIPRSKSRHETKKNLIKKIISVYVPQPTVYTQWVDIKGG